MWSHLKLYLDLSLYLYFQLIVNASDNTPASMSAEATVRVTILRNENPPVFVESTLSRNISEYTNLRETVVTVLAVDQDNELSPSGQLKYEIETAEPPIGSTYFVVSENTGEITVGSVLINTDPAPRNIVVSLLSKIQSFYAHKDLNPLPHMPILGALPIQQQIKI